MSRGIIPDYVPRYEFFPKKGSTRDVPLCLIIPGIANDWRKTDAKIDMFGVKWVPADASAPKLKLDITLNDIDTEKLHRLTELLEELKRE